MAAVMPLLCLFCAKGVSDLRRFEGDLQMLQATRNLFAIVEREEEEGCKLAQQYHQALTVLLGVDENTVSMTGTFAAQRKCDPFILTS
jgi:hypothetical protein